MLHGNTKQEGECFYHCFLSTKTLLLVNNLYMVLETRKALFHFLSVMLSVHVGFILVISCCNFLLAFISTPLVNSKKFGRQSEKPTITF